MIEYYPGSVPIKIVAKVMGKDPAWVRNHIADGSLPIGISTKKGRRTNYYVSPRLLYEYTGYLWKGEDMLNVVPIEVKDLEEPVKPRTDDLNARIDRLETYVTYLSTRLNMLEEEKKDERI